MLNPSKETLKIREIFWIFVKKMYMKNLVWKSAYFINESSKIEWKWVFWRKISTQIREFQAFPYFKILDFTSNKWKFPLFVSPYLDSALYSWISVMLEIQWKEQTKAWNNSWSYNYLSWALHQSCELSRIGSVVSTRKTSLAMSYYTKLFSHLLLTKIKIEKFFFHMLYWPTVSLLRKSKNQQ